MNDAETPPENTPWLDKVLCTDPFRLFFPLGALAGVWGVGEWLVWTLGVPVDMVGSVHTTLQSQGFLAFFVFGFLLTALPRFTGAPYARRGETLSVLAGAVAFLAGTAAQAWVFAQIGFLWALVSVWAFALRRLFHSRKAIPPSFPLLGLGMLHAAVGAFLLGYTALGQQDFGLFLVGRQLVQLGFLLCAVLGVTGKLAPFLLGHADDPRVDRVPAPTGFPRAAEAAPHLVTGLLLFASFWLDPVAARSAAVLRAALVTAHLLLFARIGRIPKRLTATTALFWTACWMLPAGLWTAALGPLYRVAGLHLVFIGGFSLLIFSFGLLVTFSHTGRAALLNGRLLPLKAVGFLTLAAAGTRFAADFLPFRHKSLLHSASGFWVVAAVTWLLYALFARAPARPDDA
jgi:uncharacterized protein involved in response to NO